MNTPWGQSDFHEHIADGIDLYSTPSHGGYHLSLARQRQLIPAAHTNNTYNGPAWWEEDCDWAVVFLSFPVEFEAFYDLTGNPAYADHRDGALRTVAVYHAEFAAALSTAEAQMELF